MAKQITLGVEENGISFTFDESTHYLYGDGKIVCPKNSLILVTDESEMFTLKKANGDVFISARYDAVEGISSKEDLVDWFVENAVGNVGGGIDPETLAELVSSAEYVSSSSTIDFKNVDGDVISTINAEPFITDGMVDNVQISGTNLVITFNIDAGKQPISIPLSSIFDPSNYYDKTAIDTMLQRAYSDTTNALLVLSAATDAGLATKADTSAVTVDEYTIYATRDNNISTAYTSTPITWVKITPKGNLGKSGSLQFSGVTGYLHIQNIDYVNGTYTVGSGSLDPSLVSGLSITFEDGAMIVEVDSSNPITYATFSNTVIEYVKTVIPQKVASDAVYDNLYPLIKKVDDSLTSVTINSASTVQNSNIISLRLRNNGNTTITNPYINLDGYLTYSGTTLKAEAYVDTGTETLTTVANSNTSSSARSDYFFINNVGQRTEANHIEIQILASDTVNLAFYGYSINGGERTVSLTVGNGTVTSGYNWPSEATYSLSDGLLTIDYAFTGATQIAPVSIYHIMATVNYGSTASVSDIVGYVKALLKDKVEVTEYIENTLKPTVNEKQDALEYYTEDGEQALIEVPSEISGANGVDVFNNGVNIYAYEDQVGETDVYVSPTGVTINDDAVVTESMLSGKADTSAVTAAVSAVTPVYVDFYRMMAQGVTDDDWDAVMAAYTTHRPLIGSLGNIYYTCESLIQPLDNQNQLRFTVSDANSRYVLTVTKNGSNDYTITNTPYSLSVDDAIDINSNNPVVNSAITAALNAKQDALIAGSGITISGNVISAEGGASSDPNKLDVSAFTAYSAATATAISGKANASDVVSISDYDEAQRVTASALNDLNDRFGGMRIEKLTQVQYDALTVKDDNTLYIITNVVNNA